AAELEGSVSLESVEGSVQGGKATFGFTATGALEKAQIERDVEIVHGEDRFRADTADFAFDAEGKLASADLAGSPSGTIAIGRYLPPGGRELRAARPQISGQGPMHLDLATGTKVSMQGPGRITAPEIALEITAGKTLEGSASEDRGSGDFAA